VILLNTCSVRTWRSRNLWQEQKSPPHPPPGSKAFWGSWADAQSRGQQLLDQLPDVDLVVGTTEVYRTGEIWMRFLRRRTGLWMWNRAGARDDQRAFAPGGEGEASLCLLEHYAGINHMHLLHRALHPGEERSRTIPDMSRNAGNWLERGCG